MINKYSARRSAFAIRGLTCWEGRGAEGALPAAAPSARPFAEHSWQAQRLHAAGASGTGDKLAGRQLAATCR